MLGSIARKSFDPLHQIIEKGSILSHYIVKISHDYNEAILVTIEEQKIDLLITDLRTFINNKKLQALVIHDMLLIRTRGNDEGLVFDNGSHQMSSLPSSAYDPLNSNLKEKNIDSNEEKT
jgi:hypothetical protein